MKINWSIFEARPQLPELLDWVRCWRTSLNAYVSYDENKRQKGQSEVCNQKYLFLAKPVEVYLGGKWSDPYLKRPTHKKA